ncbi:MAG: hypothetical protein IJQ35_06240 [Bacteroidales bacterium]|nr:hypothetical protein [Bacteroidales bacterium]MBQ9343933.1 hypothetical protein [Kiritimatiellia bacterium]
MKTRILAFWIGLVAVVGVAAAFASGTAGEADDAVVLGEEDLAERAEILRNQFRRMTPGDAPLVQDIGTWPAAWEEFSPAWDSAPSTRDLATWLVPVEVARDGVATVLLDGDGAELWRGETDFAKEVSASVTLTGALVSEEDWALWEVARQEIARRLQESATPRLRDGEGGGGSELTGLRFVSASANLTNIPPEFRVGLAWTNSGTLDVFAYGPLHVAETNAVTYTNDENVVVNTNVVTWHSVEPSLSGFDNDWTWVGTLVVTNSETNVFVDTSFTDDRAKVRFYAAAHAVDSDGDGLNDGFELFVSHSSTNSADGDHDGVDDRTEYLVGSSTDTSNVWWHVATTNDAVSGYGYQQFPYQSSWPPEPVWMTNLTVIGQKPVSNAVPIGVKLWGMVDDVIMVDSNEIAWNHGPTLFSNFDVTSSVTNMASGRFRIDLFDWPDLPNGGANEVWIGDAAHPFRVVWEWWVPIEMRMEPILGGGIFPLDNPCGVVSNGTAWFHVDVVPEGLVPETNITWTSIHQKLDILITNLGTRVQVRGTTIGEDDLQVAINGAIGDFGLPPFHVKVVPSVVVTAKVGIVTTTNTDWETQTQRVASVIATANDVLVQAGKSIVLHGDPIPIPDLANGGYYDVDATSIHFTNLLQTISAYGGLKLYFVGTIVDEYENDPDAVDTRLGMALGEFATGETLAHEVGHRFGLEDIYIINLDDPTCMVTGEIDEQRLPSDWGRYRIAGEEALTQSNLIQRLLMYSSNIPGATDIPYDEVEGFWHTGEVGNWDWDEGLAPVGLGDMVVTPEHY